GKTILEKADNTFMNAFLIAKNNKTEKNEAEYIQAIRESYREYKKNCQYLREHDDQVHNIAWYKMRIKS
ncbi:MAG: hypothetical protein K9I68_10945, partial [Bacteroidales bacterium]|nr:hypothetical protein [Bacteroidales bacterium]